MANEKRLIWDEDAKRHVIALAVGHNTNTLHIDMILNAILHHAPTVDAVEVVHGRWIYKDDTVMKWTTKAICSACKCKVAHNSELAFDYGIENFEKIHKYCPNCGAKMDGGNDNGC